LAFRGSVNIRDFLDDITFAFTECDLVAGCLVHSGFWEAWQNTRAAVLAGVAAALSAHPSYKVVVTGHSLGAAVGTLAAAELRKNGTSADLYNYGSPRLGNDIFANFVSNQTEGVNVRVTHTDDPVPRLPPIWLAYDHISPEYWIEQGDVIVTASDIEVLYGIANIDGNAGQTDFNTTAHAWYFGHISACAGALTFK
jgi:pimeloyl-ACP methyl ester carboxylesterase